MRGLCECGCGKATPPATRDRPYLGLVEGEPIRFMCGHGNRLRRLGLDRWEPRDMGYETPCWIWTGAMDADNGYGTTRGATSRAKLRAHRAVYEASRGPIAEGMQLDHLCRVRACVNPAHMEPVTAAENIQRGRVAKLTPEDIRAIRASTDLLRVLATRFGVTITTVWRIRARQTWKDLA